MYNACLNKIYKIILSVVCFSCELTFLEAKCTMKLFSHSKVLFMDLSRSDIAQFISHTQDDISLFLSLQNGY